MASVKFDGVSKVFDGDVKAVADLSLEIDDGEFMVLLGPSGCGKSTALRMIAGLETITTGTLEIGGRVVNDVEPRDRDISMVFQSYALYPHMTVRRNIESPLIARTFAADGDDRPKRKLTKSERAERVAEASRMLGLDDYLDRKPGALSGGQRQRVALARAIVSRPQVFLMDEPLSNLDAKLRTQTRAELVDLHRRVGTTVVYVTHDQVEAMTMADRIAIIADGRLQQVGTTAEVYDRPANLFVAQFIGTPPMNVLDALVVQGGVDPDLSSYRDGPHDAAGVGVGQSSVEVGGVRVAAPPGVAVPSPGTAIKLGVRPEHVNLAETGVPATVTSVEWLGHETLLGARVGDALTGDLVITRHEGRAAAQPGDQVHLAFAPGGVSLFDAESGVRL